jgi:hypothetical protein
LKPAVGGHFFLAFYWVGLRTFPGAAVRK